MKDEMLHQLDVDYERKDLTKEQYDRLRDEIIAKADQLDRLVADHNAGKVNDDDFFKWSEAIGEDYKQIGIERRKLAEKNMDLRKKKAEDKYRRPITIALLAIIMLGAGIWLVNYTYAHRSIDDVPEPVQIELEAEERDVEYFVDGKSIGRPEYYLRMNYLASYDIKGLVVTSKHYGEEEIFDRAFPVDLGLAWGEYAAKRWAMDCREGYHKMTCNYDRERLSEVEAGRQIVNLVSNNHLTPANRDIYSKIMSIKDGDYVEIKGYLISIALSDTDTFAAPFVAVSSLSRTDHMSSIFDTTNTGCELIYVTSVEWLD